MINDEIVAVPKQNSRRHMLIVESPFWPHMVLRKRSQDTAPWGQDHGIKYVELFETREMKVCVAIDGIFTRFFFYEKRRVIHPPLPPYNCKHSSVRKHIDQQPADQL